MDRGGRSRRGRAATTGAAGRPSKAVCLADAPDVLKLAWRLRGRPTASAVAVMGPGGPSVAGRPTDGVGSRTASEGAAWMRTPGWPRIACHGGPFRPNSGKAPPPPLSSAAAGRHNLAVVGSEIHGLDQTSGFLYENNSFYGIMHILHSSPLES